MSDKEIKSKYRERGAFIYLLLGGIFIALLVTCNLIFQKFVKINLLDWYTFEVSAGLLPYPITFLVTDLISELFGKKKANRVVTVGLIVSVIVMIVTIITDFAPATTWSPVSDAEYGKVFGLTAAAVTASMIAYLLAQYIDIRIFHFWKKVTKGKMLWVRNNFSTMTSQFVDTGMVLLLLCSLGSIEWELFLSLFWSGFLFKLIIAALDTPFFYLLTYGLRRYLGLSDTEEMDD